MKADEVQVMVMNLRVTPVKVEARVQTNLSYQYKRDELPEYKRDIRSYLMFKKNWKMCVAVGPRQIF